MGECWTACRAIYAVANALVFIRKTPFIGNYSNIYLLHNTLLRTFWLRQVPKLTPMWGRPIGEKKELFGNMREIWSGLRLLPLRFPARFRIAEKGTSLQKRDCFQKRNAPGKKGRYLFSSLDAERNDPRSHYHLSKTRR